MQRYTVTIVSSGATGERPVLLVPFQPSALVTAFVDELWKRIARQNLQLSANTHIATLHLDSDTGAIIDCEDLLSDAVLDPTTEKLFAVIAKKTSAAAQAPPASDSTVQINLPIVQNGEAAVVVRIVTPANAKARDTCPTIRLPVSATIRQLHDRIAQELQIPTKCDEDADVGECNCRLSGQLADGSTDAAQFFVIHGKSVVERLELSSSNEVSLKQALRAKFGVDVENSKKVAFLGAEMDITSPTTYKKPPVVALCSKHRHTPVHARADIDESGDRKSRVLDLHTSELPIHPACMESTIKDADLSALAVHGIVDIFASNRTTTGKSSIVVGKSAIFRYRSHWEPSVVQSDRGMAMFLSSLRVFTSLVQDMDDEERSQDAVLHIFDLLTNFPPALRTLHILVQGKTPTATESSALSHAVYQMLDDFMPTSIIGTDHTRVFEGARLFFGFVLEKARTVKLPEMEGGSLPYLTALQTEELPDHKTNEAVMRAVQTSTGVVEASLFEAFAEYGVLADSHLQSYMLKTGDFDRAKARRAFLSGGARVEVTAFSLARLTNNYRYSDLGDIGSALAIEELSELGHLAELCGRNKLAVHKPSQLTSAVAPCLTFDRNAHLAVYAGEQPCGDPGRSSLVFRPKHGEEAVDAAIVEQLIAPILQGYEADGTSVFDSLGGAAVRRLQAPDEIPMFCVDTSASMRQPTDFSEVNDTEPRVTEESDAQSYVEADLYNQASFEDMKERLCEYESFEDIISIIARTPEARKRAVASQVLDNLRIMFSSEIIKKSKDLESRRQHGRGWYHSRQELTRLEAALKKIKTFWAGLKTHEEAVCDFLIYRSGNISHDLAQHWTWSLGDNTPASSTPQQIPGLPDDVTEIPHNLRCPISHTLMGDAVTASDGHVYSHAAITHWFTIRQSSPMTGLQLNSISLNSNEEICDAAERWVNGDGVPGRTGGETKRLRSSNELVVTLDSRVGSFERSVLPSMTLKELYTLAFRGLRGKFMVFQLSTDRYGPLTPTPDAAIASRSIKNGDHITLRIADDDPSSGVSAAATTGRSSDLILVKIFENSKDNEFAYWVRKDTTRTLASVLWKYWRHKLSDGGYVHVSEKQVWTDMNNSGDDLLTGSPQDSADKLSIYLNRRHCFGMLGQEQVYREGPGNSGTDGPLVLKVKISPPWKQHRSDSKLTRLDVLKQMFEALINRMLAYNYKTHVGMCTFSTRPQVAMGISHVLENFRRSTSTMRADGDTAIWDALALAKEQLVEYGKKFPGAKKRIICISDGEDTKSISNTSQDVCWRLRCAGIAVDSVSLGWENNLELRTVSYLLGSYLFHPSSLVNALAICEMEPFLSITERPTITAPQAAPQHRLQFMGYFWTARFLAVPTHVTNDRVPPRKEHPNLHDDFVQLADIAAHPRNTDAAGTGNSRSNLRTSRLMNEMRAIAANAGDRKYDVYVSESDMSFWKVVMEGPEDSPYSEGTFLLYIDSVEGYPTFAPKARFITKIKHPNVNAHGRICHSIFDRDWTSDISMTTLLDTVFGLLYQPEYSDPVNTTTTLGFHHDQVEFAEEVREHVDRHAWKTRSQWKSSLLGEGEDEGIDEDDEGNEDEDMDEDHEGVEDEDDEGQGTRGIDGTSDMEEDN